MPSTNKTPHFGLNQWEANDTPFMDDFNQDNEILDQAIQLQTVHFLGNITLFSNQWVKSGQVYRQGVELPVEDGYMVDLTCDSSQLTAIENPIMAVNDNGNIYAETCTPPLTDIEVQVMSIHIKEIAK